MQINKGQKIDITKGREIRELGVYLGWDSPGGYELDSAAFLLDESGKCRKDEDFIFYNNPSSLHAAVIHTKQVKEAREGIRIVFSKLSGGIKKIGITLTIDQGDVNSQYFSQVSNPFLRLVNETDGTEVGIFKFGSDLQKETAIVVGEIYTHNGEWKFSAVASGFYGGLASLVTNFGLDVLDSESLESDPVVVQPSASAPAPSSIKMPSLSKIELSKKESFSIKKAEKITATLEWETEEDLDLYCFYVTKKGVEGKVYYNKLGSATKKPFITLDGDAREFGKETIVIHRPEELKYAMFCAYSAVSNGTGSFYSMKVKAVVDNHNGQQVIAPLLEMNDYSYWVAIAQIDLTSPTEMKVSHIESYSRIDEERSPQLYKDGTFLMDVGPVEFK